GGEWRPGSTVSFTGGSIRTEGDEAVGALAVNGALVSLRQTSIVTTGNESHGVGASTETFSSPTVGGYGPSLVTLEGVSVRTAGNGAYGLAAFNGDSEIHMRGGSITTAGEGGAGLFLGNGADITLEGVAVASKGPSILSYFGPDDDTPPITTDLEQIIEARDSNLTTNNGTLMRVDRKAGGETGDVTLELLGTTVAVGKIETYGEDGKLDTKENSQRYTHVEVADTASWIGVMVDASTTKASSGQTISGNQQGDVTAEDGAAVAFNNVSQI